MRALLGTELAALLARAGVSQAAFARVTGYTPRQVNNWCRARAAVPPWAASLAILMQDASPDAIQILLEELAFRWHETSAYRPTPMPPRFGAPRPGLLSPTTPTEAAAKSKWRGSMPPTSKPARCGEPGPGRRSRSAPKAA